MTLSLGSSVPVLVVYLHLPRLAALVSRPLRDLTRYRADLVAARIAEKNRAGKLLQDAQIKLSVVASASSAPPAAT
jgi:hypothetical protein